MSKEIIKKYNIWAKKSLGQNFLVDEWKLDEIENSIEISWKNIIEVWPWYWALTQKVLDKKPQSLHVVELDSDMVHVLEDRAYHGELNTQNIDFQIFNTDILEFSPEFQFYSVIANIPYYITSPILRHFIYDVNYKPQEMLILMQKDVGDKILWKWKNKSSVLSLMVEKKYTVSEKVIVQKECFLPVPKVESSVLLFNLHGSFEDIDDDDFLHLIKKWFSAPRKKLIKNLSWAGYSTEKIKEFICLQWEDENFRWEDGDIRFWIELTKFLL